MPDNCYPTIIPTIDNSELECCEQIKSQCVIHLDELPTLSLPEDSDLRTILNEIDTYLSSGGVSTFLELTDTPSAYTGEAGNFTRVNVGETGLEFFTLADVAISNDYNDLDNLPSVIQPTGLEAIDEGNGIGWRLIGRNPANYGNIGGNAVDFSFSSTSSTTRGARGDYSLVGGYNNTASNFAPVVSGGYLNTASGATSTVSGGESNTASVAHSTVSGGWANTASGVQSTISGGWGNTATETLTVVSGGWNNRASGVGSTVIGGYQNQAYSFGETVGGLYATTYSPASTSTFNAADRLFNIGNGTGTGTRSDAFTIFKNGASLFVPIDKSTVSNGTKGMYIYDSVDDEPKYHDGASWNSFGGGQVDSVVAGTNITVDNTDPANPIISAAGTVGEANTYSNLGAGTGIIGTKSGVDLRFKTLVEGSNITLTSDANTVTINSSGGSGSTNLSYDAAIRTVASDTGTDAVIPLADDTNAGLLSFYGNGLFTPTLIDEGGGATYSGLMSGFYTRVGKLVHIEIEIASITTTGVPSGTLRIQNLPFSVQYFSTGSVSRFTQSNVSFYFIGVHISQGTLGITFPFQNTLDGSTNTALSSVSFSSGIIYLSGTYITND